LLFDQSQRGERKLAHTTPTRGEKNEKEMRGKKEKEGRRNKINFEKSPFL
jgi:hypothetical protein